MNKKKQLANELVLELDRMIDGVKMINQGLNKLKLKFLNEYEVLHWASTYKKFSSIEIEAKFLLMKVGYFSTILKTVASYADEE